MSPRSPEQFEKARQKSRENILRSALSLFSSRGFFNTSIRDISKEAKISDGLLYNYFNSKEALAIEVLKSAFSTLDETITSTASSNPRENMELSISRFIDLLRDNNDKIRLLAQMGFHKEKFGLLNQLTISKYQGSISKFEENLKAMKVSKPAIEARILVAALDGIIFEHLLMDKPFDLEQMKQDLIMKYC